MSDLDEQEVLGHVRDWHAWMTHDDPEPRPAFLRALGEPSVTSVLVGTMTLHVSLTLSRAAASALRLHRVAARIARLRIATDRWSYEPRQCGLNDAHCNLGVSYVRLGRIDEAIDCLEQAWRVYPCPHNTSFGLNTNLCRALSPYPEAAASIARYERMARAFVGSVS